MCVFAWLVWHQSPGQKPCRDEADPPRCQEANDGNKDTVSQTKVCVSKLIELQLGEVLGRYRIGDLVMQNAIGPRNDAANERDEKHVRHVGQRDSGDDVFPHFAPRFYIGGRNTRSGLCPPEFNKLFER